MNPNSLVNGSGLLAVDRTSVFPGYRSGAVAVLAAALVVSAAEGIAGPSPGASPVRDSSASAPAPATEGAPISSIEIRPRNIFEPVPEGRLEPFYRLANRLHVRTRTRTVRDLLLFAPGEPWSEPRARETERQLRALSYLIPDRIQARKTNDSTIVSVATADLWSTTFEFNLERADRTYYGAIALTERNLLGFGKLLSLVYRQDPDGITRSLSLEDPNVLGSRVRFAYSAGHGSSGSSDRVSAGLPFFSQDAPLTYGFTWRRATSQARLYEAGEEIAQVNVRENESEAYFGRGHRRGGVITRGLVAFQVLDRDLGPTEIVVPDPPNEFVGGKEMLRLRRLIMEGRQWRPRFVERRNVESMAITEDLDLGRAATVRLGVAPRFLGSTADEGYASVAVDVGAESWAGYGSLSASASSRYRSVRKETLGIVQGRWIRQHAERGALVMAVRGVLGSRMNRDFQTEVGGLNGLRGYSVHALSGYRTWRFNVEERWTVTERLWGVLASGIVGFGDGGRAWGPGARGTEWHLGAGTGLRFSLPRWAPHQVLRVDLAWPVHPKRDGARDPVLSFGSSQAF